MSERFITHEVGSLAKPEWRIKPLTGREVSPRDIEQATSWAERLEIDADPLLHLLYTTLSGNQPVSAEAKQQVRHWSQVYATRLQEKAGLDVVYDGEQNRSEMYEHAVRRSEGFELRGLVRAFDNKYYNKFALTQEPHVATPWHTQELLDLQRITDRDIKIPVTGAYTIAAWSFDEHYRGNQTVGDRRGSDEARRQFVLDAARNLVRPTLETLIANGAKWIQIDEPAATTIPSEVPLFVEAFNESTRGLDCEFSTHVCFSDYSLLFPHIEAMENCSQYSLEFANRDSRNLGTGAVERNAYQILEMFNTYNIPGRIGLGVSDIHTDFIESPELIRDRIVTATRILGDPARINPSPDCGLRTRTWEVAFDKLSAVVEGALLAELLL